MSHRRLLDWKQKSPAPLMIQATNPNNKQKFSDDVFLKSRSALTNAVLKLPQFLFNPVGQGTTDYLRIFNSRMTEDGKFNIKRAESSQSTDESSEKFLDTKMTGGTGEEPEELKKKVTL